MSAKVSGERIRSILGEPEFKGGVDEGVWSNVEHVIGIGLPQDFKDFVEAYGPGMVNTTLYVRHPSLGKLTFLQDFSDQMKFFSEFLPGSGLPYRTGTSTGELLYFAHMMDRVDLFFLIDDGPSDEWRVCAFDPTDFDIEVFPWGFSEWLARYLEDDEQCLWLGGCGPEEEKSFSDRWAY